MSVGGWLIEIKDVVIGDDAPRLVTRLWCVDRDATETAVYVDRAPEMPRLGEEVWWQGGRVFFDNDRQSLRKVGFSFSPPGNGVAPQAREA